MNTDISNVVERTFTFNGFRYAAQLWGDTCSQQPIMALHGWLDNSASFDLLAPYLVEFSNVQVLAPDLSGHGHSDHRNGFSDYPIWAEVVAIIAMADEMQWPQFVLMGHSRGAMIALILAAMFPERVSQLVLIDAIAPSPIDAEQAPDHMLKSMQEIHRRVRRKLSCYPTYDAAIKARVNSDVTRVEPETAQRLAKRGLRELTEGFHWHADDKLWAFSHVMFTQEQIFAFVRKVQAKTLILLAEQGFMSFIKDNPIACEMNKHLINLLSANVIHFEDGHYLHIEKSALDVARSISNFIVSNKTGS